MTYPPAHRSIPDIRSGSRRPTPAVGAAACAEEDTEVAVGGRGDRGAGHIGVVHVVVRAERPGRLQLGGRPHHCRRTHRPGRGGRSQHDHIHD